MPLISSLGLMNAINFGMASSQKIVSSDLIVSSTSSPYIAAYKFANGFISKYANPSSLPAGQGNGVNFNKAKNIAVVGHNVSPYCSAYNYTKGTGFGAKLSNPSTSIGNAVNDIDFSGDDSVIYMATANSPSIVAYAWTNASGFGTRYANPSVLPLSNSKKVKVNTTSQMIAVSGDNISPFAYRWSAGWSTKVADPATTFYSGSNSIDFSPNGSYSTMTAAYSPYIMAHQVTGTTFGTAFSNPAILPNSNTGSSTSVFNKESNVVSCTAQSSAANTITAYQFSSSGFGTKFTNPSTLLSGGTSTVAMFSSDSKTFYAGGGFSGNLAAYVWDNTTGFGAKYSNPSSPVGSVVTGIAVY